MTKDKYKILTVACFTMACASAHSDIDLNGFATFSGGIASTDERDVYGYDDKIEFQEDSLVGLQLTSELNEKFSVTAQIIATGDGQWQPKFEWAYLTFDASENFKILFGRQRIPFFNYSDYLDVGYAFHWVAPPEELYDFETRTTNGIGMIYTSQLGMFNSSLHFLYGREKVTDENDLGKVDADLTNQTSLAWTLSWEWLTFRLGYNEVELNLNVGNIEGLASAWRAAGYSDIASQISMTDDDSTGQFLDFGLTIDKDNILFIAEYIKTGTEGAPLADDRDGYFVSLGYRFDRVMPHVTIGSNNADPVDYSFLNDVPNTPALAPIKAGATGLFEAAREEKDFYTLGVRWDFIDSAAFKVDYTVRKDNLINETDGVLRFAVVTVF